MPWFKAPDSPPGQRGDKPYLRFPPPADQYNLTTEVQTSYLLVLPPPPGNYSEIFSLWAERWFGRGERWLTSRLFIRTAGKGSSFLPRGFALLGCCGRVSPFRSGGSALLFVGFSVLVGILLCSLSMSRAALSTRLMGALSFRGSCSWLGERKGSWAVGYLCSCSQCAVTRHLEQ